MSVTRSQHLVPQAESGLRAGQYDGPAIGRRAKSLPLHRRVSRIGSTSLWRSQRAVFYGRRVALAGHCRTTGLHRAGNYGDSLRQELRWQFTGLGMGNYGDSLRDSVCSSWTRCYKLSVTVTI